MPNSATDRDLHPQGSAAAIVTQVASLAAILLGLLVWTGWLLQNQFLTTFVPNTPRMAGSTALCFILCGFSLWWQRRPAAGVTKTLARAAAAAVTASALVTIAEYSVPSLSQGGVLGELARRLPGQMALSTAVDFLLFGLALTLLDVVAPRGLRPAQYLILPVIASVLLGLLGSSYAGVLLGRIPYYTHMALPTMAGLLVLSVGLLCARPGQGWMAVFTSPSLGGRVARPMLLAMTVAIFVIGRMRLAGEVEGLYNLPFGVALFATATILVLAVLIWLNARFLNQVDAERHATEAELRRSESRFRTLINASTQILWTTDANGLVADDIPTWRAYTGQTIEGIRGWGWLESVHPEDRERTASTWARAVAERGAYEVQYRIRRHDGVYGHFAVRGVPLVENGAVREWIGSCTDVSSRVEIDRMKDEFVSTVSHELRTPLASLRGFTELMLSRDFSEEKRREFLGIIHRESKRLANLINDFLDIQRIESGQQRLQVEDFDVRELLRDAEQLFASGAPRHQFRIRCEERLPGVRADRERTAQVIANLVSNAVKYSPDGGAIELSALRRDGQIRIEVRDQGMGIPAEKAGSLFRKFYRVDNAANREIGGTGLGLALVKQIVEMQGGNVGVETEAGAGSTFWFTLPVSDELRGTPRSEAPEVMDILLVEDDAAFCELLREHFASLGLALVSTAYAERALELARAARPRLILLDIYLRGALCGWDLLARLKSDPELHEIPVVIVTISEPNVRGLALGGAEYISKSAEPEVLRAVIRRHLEGTTGRQVLIVEDDPLFRRRVAEIVAAEGDFHLAEAEDGDQALALMAKSMPDLLLLDLLMPRVDGFEVLRRLRGDSRAVNLQVLVVTARDLSLEERLYIRRNMASLVGKREATLDYFTEVVGNTIGFRDAVEAD